MLRHHSDPLALDAIDDYFAEVHWKKSNEMDKKHILPRLAERAGSFDFPFATIAKDFRMIDSVLQPIVVPYRGAHGKDDRIDRLLDELGYADRPGRIARLLQPYVVQVFSKVRSQLLACGAAQAVNESTFGDQFVRLANETLYDPRTGLHWDDPTFARAEAMIL